MKFQKYNYFSNALNKTYKVAFEVYKGCEENIVGILLNYNSGNIDLYNEDKGELYHIPFSGLKWLLPAKDKNKINSQSVSAQKIPIGQENKVLDG